MSRRLSDLVKARFPQRDTDYVVLLHLADRANERTGQLNPSYRVIAADCGISTRHAMRIVKRLVADGWLMRRRRQGKRGTLSNRYVINEDQLAGNLLWATQAGDAPSCIGAAADGSSSTNNRTSDLLSARQAGDAPQCIGAGPEPAEPEPPPAVPPCRPPCHSGGDTRVTPGVTPVSPHWNRELEPGRGNSARSATKTLFGADARERPATRLVCTPSQAEAIYRKYPRKVARRDAIKAIEAAAKRLANAGHDDPLTYLQQRVWVYASSPAGQPPPAGDDDYRPYPATWFNQDRFDDDETEWKRPNGTRRRASAPGNPSRYRRDDANGDPYAGVTERVTY